jgi:Fe-Mn family superoxide dismutase
MTQNYQPKTFQLSGLDGISDRTLEMHFKLYEGYVKNTNLLNERIHDILSNGKVDAEENPQFSELKRRFGFEYNGMVLHEFYFENLKRQGQGQPDQGSAFKAACEQSSFGTYDVWKADFVSTGLMRGVGWAICYQDAQGRLSNHWIEQHQGGNVAGFKPILVMDVWEHAYFMDYKPAERNKYIEAFFANMNWNVVEERLSDANESDQDESDHRRKPGGLSPIHPSV